MKRYQKWARVLVAPAMALAALLFVSSARADELAQAVVLREFFEGKKGEIASFAHPILDVGDTTATVQAHATAARIAIRYASGDQTVIDIPVDADALFPELRVTSDTDDNAFVSLKLAKALVDDLIRSEVSESADRDKDGPAMRAFQDVLVKGWEQFSGPDLYRYMLNIRWIQSGYRNRYRNAAYQVYVPPVDPNAGDSQPQYAPPPRPAPAEAPPPAYTPPPALQSDEGTLSSTRHSWGHLHDGFYFRVSAGLGPLSVRFDDKAAGGETIDGDAVAPGGALAFGGSPRPGLVVGGLVMGEGNDMKLLRGSWHANRRGVGVVLIGPFIDYFPSPAKGLHLGAAVGPSVIPIADTGDSLRTTAGAGAALWLGYDFWVANQWSLGPLVVASGNATGDSSSETELSGTAGSIKVLLTALCH
jgi:hypothetical protein